MTRERSVPESSLYLQELHKDRERTRVMTDSARLSMHPQPNKSGTLTADR